MRFDANFMEGKLYGLATTWYENGQKRSEGNWKDGKVLPSVAWKPNREKCPLTNVKDGNGVWVWYKDDGTVLVHSTYNDGEEVKD